jgi:ubiquinone/menaquinone biosynthesis C-methylase UbiE
VKAATARHWAATPIGTRTTGFHPEHAEFTPAWFEEQKRFRYVDYAPWLADLAGFERHRGDLVLEVGCGMGTDLLEFAAHGARVVGLDLTRRHLELARRRFRASGRAGSFQQGDAERLPFASGVFDFVYSCGVLHHTPDGASAVREIHRVLKPGGRATILLYHRNSFVYRFKICGYLALREIARRLLGRGGRLRDFRPADLLSASTDGPENPLTRVYSRAECRRLCAGFRQVTTRVAHLNRKDVLFLHPLPRPLLALLARRWGWYVAIEAVK